MSHISVKFPWYAINIQQYYWVILQHLTVKAYNLIAFIFANITTIQVLEIFIILKWNPSLNHNCHPSPPQYPQLLSSSQPWETTDLFCVSNEGKKSINCPPGFKKALILILDESSVVPLMEKSKVSKSDWLA